MLFLIVYSRFRHAHPWCSGAIRVGHQKELKNTTQGGVFDFWQGHLCNSRTNTIQDLLLFGKDVKVFLKLSLQFSINYA